MGKHLLYKIVHSLPCGLFFISYTMKKEIWKPVVGWEKLYSISSYGRVKSFGKYILYDSVKKVKRKYTKKEVYLKGMIVRNGYRVFVFRLQGKYFPHSAHRLVAQHFIPNPENKPCVNHKDSNPQNNYVDNLEWCTHKENTAHMYQQKRNKVGSRENVRKLTDEQILYIYHYPKVYGYRKMICKKFSIHRHTFDSIRSKKSWKKLLENERR